MPKMQDRRRGGKITLGYPVDKIGIDTKLYSLIGTNAIENKYDQLFNDKFKDLDADCKMMPLNIREDDIGFFLHGLKDSKIKGAFFEKEYWDTIYNLLQEGDEEVKFCGICDTIDIIDNQYKIHLTQGRAILQYIQSLLDIKGKTICIVGTTPSSKSFLFHLIKQQPEKIILADEIIENCISALEIIPNDIQNDIQRMQNQKLNINSDIVINFTKNKIDTNNNTINIEDNWHTILDYIATIKSNQWSK